MFVEFLSVPPSSSSLEIRDSESPFDRCLQFSASHQSSAGVVTLLYARSGLLPGGGGGSEDHAKAKATTPRRREYPHHDCRHRWQPQDRRCHLGQFIQGLQVPLYILHLSRVCPDMEKEPSLKGRVRTGGPGRQWLRYARGLLRS
jgi:hypothetical protein